MRRENERKLQAQLGKKDVPWPLYLLLSTLVAIASVSGAVRPSGDSLDLPWAVKCSRS